MLSLFRRQNKVEILKKCTADCFKDGKIFFQAYSKTVHGLGMLDGPVYMVLDKNLEELGKTILKTVEHSKVGIPHPTDWSKADKDDLLLKVSGMKNWNQLMKKAKSILVTIENGECKFLPIRFKGTRGDEKGYGWLEDQTLTCNLDPETMGKTLLMALDRCQHYLWEEL